SEDGYSHVPRRSRRAVACANPPTLLIPRCSPAVRPAGSSAASTAPQMRGGLGVVRFRRSRVHLGERLAGLLQLRLQLGDLGGPGHRRGGVREPAAEPAAALLVVRLPVAVGGAGDREGERDGAGGARRGALGAAPPPLTGLRGVDDLGGAGLVDPLVAPVGR